jgi:hypothetical protein
MIRARLSITYADDIRTLYGQIISRNPMTMQINSFSPSMVFDALEIMLQWHEENSPKCVLAEITKTEGSRIQIKIIKDLRGRAECEHRVEYKGYFDIKRIPADEYPVYMRKAERLNAANKNSIVNKIQSMLPNETISNQHMFRFLIEMDAKLDRLLSLADRNTDEEGLETVKALYISSGGCGFFSKEQMKAGEALFMGARSFDTGGKLRFSAVGKVSSVKQTKLGTIADVVFEDMEEAVRENIIRYVFEKDRELLQEAREK